MIKRFFFIALVISYAALIIPFTTYLKNRPIAVKLGYIPSAEVLKVAAADHRYLVAEMAVVKVLFYFGSIFEKQQNKVVLKPEYFNMYRILETAVKLDPYNMDAYYFAQASFTWEVGRAKDVNSMLLYGMKYRTWDYILPFYVAFNYAYFLKDYNQAALYMKKAAELSGIPLLTTLAARYLHETRQVELGIAFLEVMEKGAKDKNIKKMYQLRKNALISVKILNDAVERYKIAFNKVPRDLNELVSSGIIGEMPHDPYGGRFYMAEDGMIRSTSKFTFGSQHK